MGCWRSWKTTGEWHTDGRSTGGKGLVRWLEEMVVTEGFMEVEGTGREEMAANKGGRVDGRGIVGWEELSADR